METRRNCRICHITKDVTEFRKDKSYKDGIGTICKLCNNGKKKEYYQKQKISDEHVKELAKYQQLKLYLDDYKNLSEDDIDHVIYQLMEQVKKMKELNI